MLGRVLGVSMDEWSAELTRSRTTEAFGPAFDLASGIEIRDLVFREWIKELGGRRDRVGLRWTKVEPPDQVQQLSEPSVPRSHARPRSEPRERMRGIEPVPRSRGRHPGAGRRRGGHQQTGAGTGAVRRVPQRSARVSSSRGVRHVCHVPPAGSHGRLRPSDPHRIRTRVHRMAPHRGSAHRSASADRPRHAPRGVVHDRTRGSARVLGAIYPTRFHRTLCELTLDRATIFDRSCWRICAAIGGTLVGLGFVLSSFTTSLWQFYG